MRTIICVLVVCAVAAGPVIAEEEQPAFRLLNDYLEKEAKEEKVGGAVMTAAGGLLIGAGTAAAVWSFTRDPAEFADQERMYAIRYGSIAGAGVGGLLTGAGIAYISRPDDFYKRKYANLYSETDPVVQEALAYGIIKDRAEEARRGRISSGIINAVTPLIGIGISAGVAAARKDWSDFEEDTLDSLLWSSGSMIRGFVQLFITKTEEERLLDSYVSVRSSYRRTVGSQ